MAEQHSEGRRAGFDIALTSEAAGLATVMGTDRILMIPDRGQGRLAFSAPYPLCLHSLGTTTAASGGLRGLFAVTSQSLLADCEQVPGAGAVHGLITPHFGQ